MLKGRRKKYAIEFHALLIVAAMQRAGSMCAFHLQERLMDACL
jgi:hypothetical protein